MFDGAEYKEENICEDDMEGRNKGLRSIFIIFWVIGSIFWVMIGALDGNFTQSVITISIGWVVLFLYFFIKDEYSRRKWNDLEND